MEIIKTIDLWNDHKPSQSIDPFLSAYFHEETETFDYDKVILAPNLIGNYQVIFNDKCEHSQIEDYACPEFNGGIIFLKNGKPIRLYLCQVNEIVRNELGRNYGTEDIISVLNSEQIIGKTGKTLFDLLEQNNIEVVVDGQIKSKFKSEKGYASKNDAVLESADCMEILTSSTFLDNINNWETANFFPNMVLNLGVVGKDFEIDIEHKGYILGVKQNIEGLREGQHGKKLYGIALQTGKPIEYKKMMEYTKSFTRQVGIIPSKETTKIELEKSLLDL